MLNKPKTFCFKKLSSYVRNYSKKQRNVVLTGAVRTPIHSGNSLCKPKILVNVIDEVIKRAAISKEYLDEVHVVGLNEDEVKEQLPSESRQLRKNVTLELNDSATKSLSNAMQKLNTGEAKTILLCGVETKPLKARLEEFNKIDFDLEKMQIFHRPKRCLVKQDELIVNEPATVAAAVALSVHDYPAKLDTMPLASLLHESSNSKNNVCKILESILKNQGLQKENIALWELLLAEENVAIVMQSLVKNPSKVNQYGFVDILRHMPSIAPIVLLTHLVHSLPTGKTGCICVQSENDSFTTMLLEKFSYPLLGSRPTLLLYTKHCCPLCDELVDELQQNFPNEYTLEKIFIDEKENVRFLRLYRNDIPVLFLNGQFFCMHRLNKTLLRRMLSISNENQNI